MWTLRTALRQISSKPTGNSTDLIVSIFKNDSLKAKIQQVQCGHCVIPESRESPQRVDSPAFITKKKRRISIDFSFLVEGESANTDDGSTGNITLGEGSAFKRSLM